MKKLPVLLLAFAACVLLIAAGEPVPRDSYSMPAKQGAVTFGHKAHIDRAGKKCNTCHHDAKEDGTGAKACDTCHGKPGKAPSMKDAMHKDCKGCHEKDKTNKAPTKCAGCHKK